MKKVLILAYDFPPYISVGGLRPKSWVDYLYLYNIEVVLITRQWNNKYQSELDYIDISVSSQNIKEITEKATIIRTAYKPNLPNRILLKYGKSKFKVIRRLLSAYYEYFQFILPIGTKIELYKAAKDYLSKNKVDCIIATGDPFVLFKYASKLGDKHNVPWIADYRDAWSSIYELQNKVIEEKWNRYFEKKIAISATKIITVSDFVKFRISELVSNTTIDIIPNGFDPISVENALNIKQKNDRLRIVLAGTISEWNAFDRFLETFQTFILEQENISSIELNLYGVNIESELKEKITYRYPSLLPILKFHPKTANHEVLNAMTEANALLLLNNFSFMGTKIYDYIGVKRKILLCFTNDVVGNKIKEKFFPINEIEGLSNQLQADLISETNSGIAVKDAEHLKEVLHELVEEFKSTGQIACHSKNVENYSRKIQVEKLAELIKSIC